MRKSFQLAQLQPFILALFPQECMGHLGSFGLLGQPNTFLARSDWPEGHFAGRVDPQSSARGGSKRNAGIRTPEAEVRSRYPYPAPLGGSLRSVDPHPVHPAVCEVPRARAVLDQLLGATPRPRSPAPALSSMCWRLTGRPPRRGRRPPARRPHRRLGPSPGGLQSEHWSIAGCWHAVRPRDTPHPPRSIRAMSSEGEGGPAAGAAGSWA